MLRITIATVLVSFASISTAQPQSSEYEQKEANQVLLRCIYRYSMELDDGSTNVETVAKAAANSCRRENSEFVDVLTRGVYPIDRQRILEKSYEHNIEAATYFLLKSRKEKTQ